MRCPRCATAASPEAKFCSACGAQLLPVCPRCARANSAGARFCNQCGSDLNAAATHPGSALRPSADPPGIPPDARDATSGEGRKLVTVLFGDVADFTSMSERLDAEEAHDIMRPCFELMREAVHRYGGTVSQFMGDGIMALFGAPSPRRTMPNAAYWRASASRAPCKISKRRSSGAVASPFACASG